MAAYCRLDADVLRQGVESFRTGFVQTHGLDPLHNLTIAQACQKSYFQHFLPEDTMAAASVRPVPVHSIEAESWLRHVENRGLTLSASGGCRTLRKCGPPTACTIPPAPSSSTTGGIGTVTTATTVTHVQTLGSPARSAMASTLSQ